jgi:hypothetical protein
VAKPLSNPPECRSQHGRRPGRKLLFGGPFEHHREAIVVPRLEAAVHARFLAPLLEPRLHAGISNVTGDGVFVDPDGRVDVTLSIRNLSKQRGRNRQAGIDLQCAFQRLSRLILAAEEMLGHADADVQRRITGSQGQRLTEGRKRSIGLPIAQGLPADLGEPAAGLLRRRRTDESHEKQRRETNHPHGALQQRDDGFVA